MLKYLEEGEGKISIYENINERTLCRAGDA